MANQFAHLHVHTEYSLLDGAAKVKPLLAEAQRLGMPAIAMTDHGNMCGAYEFYQAAKKTSVKPIIGIEAYVAPASRTHKKPVFWGHSRQRNQSRQRSGAASNEGEGIFGEGSDAPKGAPDANDEFGEGGDVSGAGAYTHMTMLAENATGLRNLFRLSSLASFEGFYKKPRMDRELIAEHAAGIIATTGCAAGEVQTRLRLGQRREAMQAASDYRDIFGKENFFVELMDHGLTIERSVREGLLEIGRKLGLRPLATNDSHYVTPDQATAHAALLCVQTGKTLSDPTRFKFDGDGYYLKSAEEMRDLWDRVMPGATDNTLLIAERVQSYEDVFAPRQRWPVFPVPDGYTPESLLAEHVWAGLAARFPAGLSEERRARATSELEIISATGFPSYFLVVEDIVAYARSRGIQVGPGRGSAAGSLVAYALRVIDVDPLQHGLLFERFINPERVSPPDIDLDFDDRRRDEVFAYVVEKYGSANVARVITFNKIKTKAAIKDSARVLLGQEGFALADRIVKALPPAVAAEDIPLAGITDREHPRYAEAAGVRALMEADPAVAKVMDTARGLEGLTRNVGVHSCATIVSSQPLLGEVPLWRRPEDGAIITSFDYVPCEDMGLLKMDILGLSNLTVIGDTVAAVRANHGVEIDLPALALDDAPTYELLARGDTLGVFQLDSSGIRDLLRRMKPTAFGDIVAAIALYRPGPMGMNAHNDYADRKNGRQEIAPIHPELAEPLAGILAETHGLIVYQEQIMHAVRAVAGYSLGRADILRKAMGKKKPEVLAAEREGFFAGMAANGYSEEAAQALWDTILPFAGYAFNKSHATGYAYLGYWTAHLKTHYPAEFMAALLTANGDNKDKLAIYLAECRTIGIRVLSPDVNASTMTFSAAGRAAIRFGLGAVRNVGEGVVSSIVAARADEPYANFGDFAARATCNKGVAESLIKAGAFDSLGHSRRKLFAHCERVITSATSTRKHEKRGQFDLFAEDDSVSATAGLALDGDDWPKHLLLSHERDMLGLYVSAHPLDGTEEILRGHAPQTIADVLTGGATEGEVVIAGMITSVERKISRAGKPLAVVTVEDLGATIEIVFFSRSYEAVSGDLHKDQIVAIKARINQRNDQRNDQVSYVGSGLIVLDTTREGAMV